jgi:CDGSH-type Zn-finger protein/truncated hemoglobin YjbI
MAEPQTATQGQLAGEYEAALRDAAACLYAGCSLKSDASEGGLTEPQAAVVRGWKARLTAAAVAHLADLSRIHAVLATQGADPPAPGPLPLRPYSEEDDLGQIRAEYLTTAGEARQAGVPFEPVRRVAGAAPGALEALFAGVWGTVLARLADDATVARLVSSVLRPLGEALARTGGTTRVDTTAGDRIWELAREATRLRVREPGLPSEFVEATAALQDLAVRAADGEARRAELREMQAELAPGIQASLNGPYLATNVDTITDHLGVALAVPPQVALCRCGASATKPFCDGSHAQTGFTGAKDPKRVPDRRDTYRGLQVTILDNRGICAHSGFCTDRLATAFHAGSEPFVTPSGARLDDLVSAVRSCPSGALSYAIDGTEARDQVDQDRPPAIEVSKDGPYRITGGIPLTDGHGAPEPRNTGASLEHYSLCRCGQSQNKPFCSGMHWYVNFADPPPPEDPNLFQWAGGLPALRRMTKLFYAKYVPEEPLLARLFADMSPDHPEKVAAWLGEVFGGPKTYTERHGGYAHMISQHLGKGITEPMRARWAALIQKAADDAGLPADPEFRAAFVAYIEWGSRIAVENSSAGAQPPEGLPVPRWWWVCDATPAARVSALAPQEEEPPPPPLPGEDEPVSFAAHIKPLFRSRDRNSMKFAFDLWSHDDVCRHGEAIIARLRAGSMPCDGTWPAEWIAVLQRWLDSGMPD